MAIPGSEPPVAAQPTPKGFHSFENAAADAVLAISYSASGKRCAVASADHKLRIYDSGDQNDYRAAILMDQWRAHDAEILDVSLSKDHQTESRSTFNPRHLRRKEVVSPTAARTI